MNNQITKPAHILLVEDNEGDILLTQEAFEESKISTSMSVTKNGQDALDFVFKRGAFHGVKTPDLILLDINLPMYSGHEVLRQIKADPKLRRIPVIMLTTSSNQKDIAGAYESHCNSYITKPLEVDDFLKAVLKIEEFWLQLTTLSTD